MSDDVDYIIVGAGSAGAVLASRLSEDPTVKVAVIEAGGATDSLAHRIPAGVALLSPRKGKHNWAFESVAQSGLGGRRSYQPRGRGLGGTSAINGMVYIRGNRKDFDDWAMAGNDGWDYESVLPYFKRAECNDRLGEPFHGQAGPLGVSDQRTDNRFAPVFLQAAIEAGYKINADFNGTDQDGVGSYQVTQRNGERSSSSVAYLGPDVRKRSNLRIISDAHVRRIHVANGRANGIEYEREGPRSLMARREVIIAAGALQSPQLLMLSGIGDPTALQHLEIPVVAALPGVGQNLQDHFGFSLKMLCSHPDLFGLSLKGLLRLIPHVNRWRTRRRGALTSNYSEVGGFFRTDPDLDVPDVQLHLAMAMIEDHGRQTVRDHGFSISMCCLQPRSRGSVTLSSPDPMTPPMIDPRFLTDEADLEILVKSFKMVQHLMSQPAMKQLHVVEGYGPVSTDDDIRSLIRSKGDALYHPAGTCAMGAGEGAVVDARLRVHGIRSLRVADVSIMPTIVAGNTNAGAIMIGEKAADMIKEDWDRGLNSNAA